MPSGGPRGVKRACTPCADEGETKRSTSDGRRPVHRAAHRRADLLTLSDETLLHVLSQLEASDVARAERVCRKLARLARDAQVR